jgi:hypothetical protein
MSMELEKTCYQEIKMFNLHLLHVMRKWTSTNTDPLDFLTHKMQNVWAIKSFSQMSFLFTQNQIFHFYSSLQRPRVDSGPLTL